MTARGGEHVDLPVVRPAPERVRIHAEHAAGLTEGQPVLSLGGRGRRGDAVNVGESDRLVTGSWGGRGPSRPQPAKPTERNASMVPIVSRSSHDPRSHEVRVGT